MEYKHTVTIKQDAWFIRLYIWLWEGDPKNINLCKLFWGYVFFLPGLIFFTLIVVPGTWIADTYQDRKGRRELENRPPREKKEHPIMQRILGGVSFFFSKVALLASTFWYHVSKFKKFNYVLSRVIIGLGGLISIVAVGFVLVVAVNNITVTGLVLGVILAAFMAVIIILALKTVGFFDFSKKAGTGFFSVLKAGLIAVKSNTCPEIKVIDENVSKS